MSNKTKALSSTNNLSDKRLSSPFIQTAHDNSKVKVKPTYKELEQMILRLSSDAFDWYCTDSKTVSDIYKLGTRIEESR
jgi:hypothetical protein